MITRPTFSCTVHQCHPPPPRQTGKTVSFLPGSSPSLSKPVRDTWKLRRRWRQLFCFGQWGHGAWKAHCKSAHKRGCLHRFVVAGNDLYIFLLSESPCTAFLATSLTLPWLLPTRWISRTALKSRASVRLERMQVLTCISVFRATQSLCMLICNSALCLHLVKKIRLNLKWLRPHFR